MILLSALFSLATIILAKSDTSSLAERGLLYIGSDHPSDYSIFTSSHSPLTWYSTYSTYPASLPGAHALEFVPMIHGINDVDNDVSAIKSLSNVHSVLVFNEPDGSTKSGGSNVSPSDAAEAFINTIAPLRDNQGLKLSLPATTGSPSGLKWLQSFNTSCHRIQPQKGCEFDFIAAHWYGDFAAMASWLGTLHAMYRGKPVWLTEFALPSASADATLAMLNESLPFLDETEWVERYAWFGTFREDASNEWTGDGVAMLNNKGGLTELGAQYMGGNVTGFEEGDSGSTASSGSNNSGAMGTASSHAGAVAVVAATFVALMVV